MKEFLNTEKDFDFSWLPKEELQVPDSIASEDLQTAINVFCDEVSEFLIVRCPEHRDQIRQALRHGQTFREIYDMTHDCSKSMKTLAMMITDWLGAVFAYQLLDDAFGSMDHSFLAKDTRWYLEHPEKSDIPRRITAMRRLREMWQKVPETADIGEIYRISAHIDMRDWAFAVAAETGEAA